MLGSILTPAGGGRPSRARAVWARLAAAHSAGSMLAAASVGVLLAGLGSALPSAAGPARAMALATIALYLPRELGWTNWPPLLQSTWQVPREWIIDHPRPVGAFLFGLGLGTGFTTRLVVPTLYVLVLVSLLVRDPLAVVAIWAAYGLVRSLHLWWLVATGDPRNPIQRASEMGMRLIARRRWLHRLDAVLLVGSAVVLGVGASR